MRTSRSSSSLAVLALSGLTALAAAGCAGDPSSQENDFTSAVATLLDFAFDGEIVTAAGANPTGAIRAQLLYTVGTFNGEKGVSRLNAVKLTSLVTAALPGGLARVRYHASLPVAWASKTKLPTSYTLSLPKRLDPDGQASFLAKYATTCGEDGGKEVTAGNFWYHYRPRGAACAPAAGDITVSKATIAVSPLNKDGKLPEYHRVWEDGALDIVAVFGKYEKGATSNDDAGIAAYNAFLRAAVERLPSAATTPLALPDAPGAAMPDVTLQATLDDGRTVSVVALLVDEVASAPPSFDARFGEVTPGADLVIYDGHAGLGANIRALTPKARFFPGKYQLFFMNGCDTFAYEDDSLLKTHAAINPDDPLGSKYLDVMRNAMPAYFNSMPDASMAVIDALLEDAAPLGYADIFKGIDAAQVVVVTGEEDNVYTPAFAPGPRWSGWDDGGAVGYKQTATFTTGTLPAGKYVFTMTPDPSSPGGDADLYLRVGSAPTITAAYKCMSYKWNSNERCAVTLTAPARVFMQTSGDKQSVTSPYLIRAWQAFP
jgi:hypothetical protein